MACSSTTGSELKSSNAGGPRWGGAAGKLTAFHYPGNVRLVAIALSKLTAQGQISVPAQVRKKLGVGPGSVLEWCERGDEIVVRRAARFSSADIHAALFSVKPPAPRKNADDLKQGIREYVRKKHAGR